ncbi:hypothetical protein ABW19_dt0205978 [Dactylella cylindrospora]|nr:hypothetical protein ABW19_dt0205978 [Dactylella cylindrospora]
MASLPVKGLTWKVPAIHEEHFTVQVFQTVIERLKQFNTVWAWVDIACIDQEDEAENAEEVGRQASIFKNAFSAYVWLSHLSLSDINSAFKNLENIKNGLTGYLHLVAGTDEVENTTFLPWLMSTMHEGGYFDPVFKLFSDPWFSSLWALQESMLRGDAIVLSREGDPLCVADTSLSLTDLMPPTRGTNGVFKWSRDQLKEEETTGHLGDPAVVQGYIMNGLRGNPWYRANDSVSLFKIARESYYIYKYRETCKKYLAKNLGSDGKCKEGEEKIWIALTKFDELCEKISQAGFHNRYNENPNVYYGMARYRKTSRPVDRIYAITQIYNLRVGKSIRQWDSPTLDQLKDEFAVAMNKRCPILGQLFVHLAEPEIGKSWRITENSTAIKELLFYKDPVPTSSFECDPDGTVRIVGKGCLYHKLYSVLKSEGKKCQVFLDSPAESYFPAIPEESLYVIELGHTEAGGEVKDENYDRCHIGILLRRDEVTANTLDVNIHQRVGVFVWAMGELGDEIWEKRNFVLQ